MVFGAGVGGGEAVGAVGGGVGGVGVAEGGRDGAFAFLERGEGGDGDEFGAAGVEEGDAGGDGGRGHGHGGFGVGVDVGGVVEGGDGVEIDVGGFVGGGWLLGFGFGFVRRGGRGGGVRAGGDIFLAGLVAGVEGGLRGEAEVGA